MRVTQRSVILAATSVFVLSGCVSYAGEDQRVAVPGPASLVAEVAPGDRVELDFEQGELNVTGYAGNQVQAEVEILCPEGSSRCAARAARAEFISRRADSGLQIALRNAPGKGAQFRYRVRVPAHGPLDVRLKYGDLLVEDQAGDVNVRMTAGAIALELPADAFAAVDLAASVGEATLTTSRAAHQGRRPLLVGAEVDWREGEGVHRARARVRFGDIDANLRD